MLKLITAGYCRGCQMFEAAVAKMKVSDGGGISADIEIHCAHEESCAAIAARLKKETGNICPQSEAQTEPKKETEAVKAGKQKSKWERWKEWCADRLRWIDIWDVADVALSVVSIIGAIFLTLLLILFSVGIIRLFL